MEESAVGGAAVLGRNGVEEEKSIVERKARPTGFGVRGASDDDDGDVVDSRKRWLNGYCFTRSMEITAGAGRLGSSRRVQQMGRQRM